MDATQFSLFFAAIVIAYVLIHIRLLRFEKYLKQVSVLQVLNDRLKGLADSMGNIRIDRLEDGLQQLHEDLQEVKEVEKKIERGQVAVREGGSVAAAEKTASRIRSTVEERLLHLGYHNLRILTDLRDVSLESECEVLVECEKKDMPYKGRVVTKNGSISDVQLHSVAQSFRNGKLPGAMTEQSFSGHTAVAVSDLKDHVGQEVLVQGWLYNMTGRGKLRFLLLRDGTGIVQAVMVKKNVSEEDFEAAAALTQESSLRLIGTVKEDERSPGGVELSVTSLNIVQIAEPYPITPKEHGTAFLMEHRHLWLRSKKQSAIMRIRDEVIFAIREFFRKQGFACVDSPMFTPNACEGTTTLFSVDYFGDEAFLTQSGQLYGEASAMALGKIYVFGPTFRAEKSKTRRHLTEFWMVEPEAAFYDLDDVMVLAENFVSTIVGRVLAERSEDLEILERDIKKLEPAASTPYPRVTYDDAVKVLHSSGHEDFPYGDDFGAPHETCIGDAHDRPVMVHRWPAEIKAFYMKRDPQNDKLALGVDMIASEGYGEIIGGAQREDDLGLLEKRIEEHDLSKEAFRWFSDLRRYGSVPHGGFGLGLERTLAWICGVEHLRECIPFPRMLYKIYP